MPRAVSDTSQSQCVEATGHLLSEINLKKHIESSFDCGVLLCNPSDCRGIMADEFQATQYGRLG